MSLPSTVPAAHAPLPATTSAPAGHPVWIPADRYPVFGMLFPSSAPPPARIPVLLCGPFGWEDVTAHRPLRAWAQHLAVKGHPSLRIDLPGTGDSAGAPTDEELVAAWRGAIGSGATWLAEAMGTTTVTVLGIGMSGLLAVQATADAPAIGDLALWGVSARGRAMVRQLQAFAQMERQSAVLDVNGEPVAERPDGDTRLAPGGFLLSDDTQAALRAIDLTACPLPTPPSRRVLLLERDGMPVDKRLRAHLEATGAAVTVAPGDGFGTMTEHPQATALPTMAMRSLDEWLGEAPSSRDESRSEERRYEPTGSLVADGVRETPLAPEPGGPPVFGMVSEPVDEPTDAFTIVFLNAGAVRRIGPNRMWVEAARRWAAAGVPCVRVDIGNLGDAPTPIVPALPDRDLHRPERVNQLVATLDRLQASGLPGRFVLVGLCAGGWLAFTAAGRDSRVCAAVLFNPRALVWSDHLADERDARVGKRIVRRSQWIRVLRGEIDPARVRAILQAIVRYPVGIVTRRRHRKRLAAALNRLETAGVDLTFAFTANEPVHAELVRDGHADRLAASPRGTIVAIPGRDHTMRPLSEQAYGHAVLDAALTRLLTPSAGT